jgi:hypothetical protein
VVALSRRFAGQTQVAQAEEGARAFGHQRDLHGRGSWWHCIVSLPTAAEGEAAGRIDLPVFAHGDVGGIDLDAKPAAGPGIELSAGSHPGHELGGLHQV